VDGPIRSARNDTAEEIRYVSQMHRTAREGGENGASITTRRGVVLHSPSSASRNPAGTMATSWCIGSARCGWGAGVCGASPKHPQPDDARSQARVAQQHESLFIAADVREQKRAAPATG
jgi:hypothetical protein